NIPVSDPIARDRIASRAFDFDFSRRDGNTQTPWLGRNIHHPHPPVGADVTETLHAFVTPLLQQSIAPPNVTRRSRSFCDSVGSYLENRAAAVFDRRLQGKIAATPRRSRRRAEVS